MGLHRVKHNWSDLAHTSHFPDLSDDSFSYLHELWSREDFFQDSEIQNTATVIY